MSSKTSSARRDPAIPPASSVGLRLPAALEYDVAALTIEAMRLGVVPSAEISAYTVGRDAELALIEADLAEVESRGGAVRAFLGDYGSGKTHLLELVMRRALAAGYLATRVTLDPRETSPSHPKRVYRSLVRSLRYPEQTVDADVGLRPLLDRASGSDAVAERFCVRRSATDGVRARLAKGAHLYLTPALQYFAAIARSDELESSARTGPGNGAAEPARELLVDWLEGHPTISNQLIDRVLARRLGRFDRIYSLKDFRPWARIYGYLLSGLSCMARTVGYRGLVVLVDEAEFYALLSSENRDFAQTFFKALTYAAVGHNGSTSADEALPFDEDDLSHGGYGVLQSLPPSYDAQAGLYVVLAMTPNPEGLEVLQATVPADRTREIGQLGRDDYLSLVERVCELYASTYSSVAVPEAVVRPLGKVVSGLLSSGLVENPRQAMKFAIEFLDVVNYRPDRVVGVLRSLNDYLAF